MMVLVRRSKDIGSKHDVVVHDDRDVPKDQHCDLVESLATLRHVTDAVR
jgi:hypothetical protein